MSNKKEMTRDDWLRHFLYENSMSYEEGKKLFDRINPSTRRDAYGEIII